MMTGIVSSDLGVLANAVPQPTGWRLLVEPIRVEQKTDGGIILAEQTIAAKEQLRYIGRVVAMGDLCYKHPKFEGSEPWCGVGDWVVYNAYAGQAIAVAKEGERALFKLLNDDEVLAVAQEPEALVIYV